MPVCGKRTKKGRDLSVCALHLYLSPIASISPCSLFCLSPFAFSFFKNAFTFFLRDVISSAYSSSSCAPPSASGSSSAPSSSRTHNVRGVAASCASARNASLSSVLAVASWSSASVLTSIYLSAV